MKELIEKVLEEFADMQPNMASKTAREIIAAAIERALIEFNEQGD